MTLVIRPHMLPNYADCERRAVANAFRGRIEAAGFRLRDQSRGIGAVVGTGVHKGVESLLRGKLEKDHLGGLDDAVERGVGVMREESAPGVTYDDTTPGPNDAIAQMRRMVGAYRQQIAPLLVPVYVETRFEAAFEGIIVSGQGDVITQELNETVRDTKTGARKRANQAQLGAYRMIREAHGARVGRVVEDFIPRVSMKKDQPPAVTYEYDLDVAAWSAWSVLNRAVAAMHDFEARQLTGERPPEYAFIANPASMLCGPKYCSAHGTTFCKEHA